MDPNHHRHPHRSESLPFTIRSVSSEAELLKAVAIRRSAYGRHVPELAARFTTPESSDLDGSSRVLVALTKLEGLPLGSMRFRTNQHRKLDLEQSVTLPESLNDRVLTEATRLAVSQAAVGRVVKAMLLKAMFLQCEASGIECIVAAARRPMDRFYEWLLFKDVFPGGDYIPMAHAGMIPHKVMFCDVAATKRRWIETTHPWYSLFFETHHPDIDLEPFVAPHSASSPAADKAALSMAGRNTLR